MCSTGLWPTSFTTMVGWSKSTNVDDAECAVCHLPMIPAASSNCAERGGPSSVIKPSSCRTAPTIAPTFVRVHAESKPTKSLVIQLLLRQPPADNRMATGSSNSSSGPASSASRTSAAMCRSPAFQRSTSCAYAAVSGSRPRSVPWIASHRPPGGAADQSTADREARQRAAAPTLPEIASAEIGVGACGKPICGFPSSGGRRSFRPPLRQRPRRQRASEQLSALLASLYGGGTTDALLGLLSCPTCLRGLADRFPPSGGQFALLPSSAGCTLLCAAAQAKRPREHGAYLFDLGRKLLKPDRQDEVCTDRRQWRREVSITR